jgi:mannose-1-phosphate guanylyltransferase
MYCAVVMAGGSGTRLWPLSRQKYPKQALKLVGDRTMFQYAVERITPLFSWERILVVTRAEHAPILMEQTPDLPADNFILEPEGRGTAPAIGLAAIHLQQRDPEATMAILTADHYITETGRFCQALRAAEEISSDGSLVTLGIRPSSASTGFGYIQQGSSLGEKNGFKFYAVQRFTEKPDPKSADLMVKSGNYSWNSGMFIWRVERILEEFERQMPDFYARLLNVKCALTTPDYASELNRIWPGIAKQTIDYGVMEAAHQVIVIPVEIGWADIGSWGSLLELLPADEEKNVLIGNHLEIDTKGTLVFGSKRLVATMGINDLIIVDTEDAVMVCSREREQDVKAIVDRLKDRRQLELI